MNRKSKALALFLLISLLVTGCWDIKGIQDLNYLTSIGFDYEDGQYIVYGQMIDFSTVAKLESGKPTQPVPVWVGIGKGATIVNAINDLYRTTQMKLFFGQINAIVVGEKLLARGITDIREAIGRYYEMRYTPWIFGSKQPIDKLFTITPFFNLSPLMSVLHQPVENYKQRSIILPITIRDFSSIYREPDKAILLPSLTITEGNWKAGNQSKSMLEIDGVFVYQNESYKGFLMANQILGLRWMEPKTNRSPALIHSDGEVQATVSLEQPKVKIVPSIENGKSVYNVEVSLTGNISEVLKPISEAVLEQKAAQLVKREIVQTFKEGLNIQADIYGLQHTLYRKSNKQWKALRSENMLHLDARSLHQIKVDVKLDHSGKLKL